MVPEPAKSSQGGKGTKRSVPDVAETPAPKKSKLPWPLNGLRSPGKTPAQEPTPPAPVPVQITELAFRRALKEYPDWHSMSEANRIDAIHGARMELEAERKLRCQTKILKLDLQLDITPTDVRWITWKATFETELLQGSVKEVLDKYFNEGQRLIIVPPNTQGVILDIQTTAAKEYEKLLAEQLRDAKDNLVTKLTMLHFGLAVAPMTLNNVLNAGKDEDDLPDILADLPRVQRIKFAEKPLEFLDLYLERSFGFPMLRRPKSKIQQPTPVITPHSSTEVIGIEDEQMIGHQLPSPIYPGETTVGMRGGAGEPVIVYGLNDFGLQITDEKEGSEGEFLEAALRILGVSKDAEKYAFVIEQYRNQETHKNEPEKAWVKSFPVDQSNFSHNYNQYLKSRLYHGQRDWVLVVRPTTDETSITFRMPKKLKKPAARKPTPISGNSTTDTESILPPPKSSPVKSKQPPSPRKSPAKRSPTKRNPPPPPITYPELANVPSGLPGASPTIPTPGPGERVVFSLDGKTSAVFKNDYKSFYAAALSVVKQGGLGQANVNFTVSQYNNAPAREAPEGNFAYVGSVKYPEGSANLPQYKSGVASVMFKEKAASDYHKDWRIVVHPTTPQVVQNWPQTSDLDVTVNVLSYNKPVRSPRTAPSGDRSPDAGAGTSGEQTPILLTTENIRHPTLSPSLPPAWPTYPRPPLPRINKERLLKPRVGLPPAVTWNLWSAENNRQDALQRESYVKDQSVIEPGQLPAPPIFGPPRQTPLSTGLSMNFPEPYFYPITPSDFARKAEEAQALRNSCLERMSRCQLCDTTFPEYEVDQIAAHLKSHQDALREVGRCPLCDCCWAASNKQQRKDHLWGHQKQNESDLMRSYWQGFQCPICDEDLNNLPSNDHVLAHMADHPPGLLRFCDRCGRDKKMCSNLELYQHEQTCFEMDQVGKAVFCNRCGIDRSSETDQDHQTHNSICITYGKDFCKVCSLDRTYMGDGEKHQHCLFHKAPGGPRKTYCKRCGKNLVTMKEVQRIAHREDCYRMEPYTMDTKERIQELENRIAEQKRLRAHNNAEDARLVQKRAELDARESAVKGKEAALGIQVPEGIAGPARLPDAFDVQELYRLYPTLKAGSDRLQAEADRIRALRKPIANQTEMVQPPAEEHSDATSHTVIPHTVYPPLLTTSRPISPRKSPLKKSSDGANKAHSQPQAGLQSPGDNSNKSPAVAKGFDPKHKAVQSARKTSTKTLAGSKRKKAVVEDGEDGVGSHPEPLASKTARRGKRQKTATVRDPSLGLESSVLGSDSAEEEPLAPPVGVRRTTRATSGTSGPILAPPVARKARRPKGRVEDAPSDKVDEDKEAEVLRSPGKRRRPQSPKKK